MRTLVSSPAASSGAGPGPPRPLFTLALALAAGACVGLGAGLDASGAELALAVLLATGVAWTLGWCAAGGGGVLGATATEARGPSAWLVALAFAAAAARAGGTDAPPAEHAPPPGTYSRTSALAGRELGRIGASPVKPGTPATHATSATIELPLGLVREGERIAVLDTAERTRGARGLVPTAERSVWTPRADEVVRLAPARDRPRPFVRARERLLAACARAGGAEHGPWLAALVCGDTSRFDGETLDLFTRTGTRHLLAVSGQHVTWIAVFALRPLANFLGACLGRLRPAFGARFADGLLLALVAAYVPLAGGESPVRRAALAFALALAAGAWARRERGGRRVDALSLWSAALVGELCVAPRALGEVALVLSYAATLGLIVGTLPFARLFSGPRRFELAERPLAALARRARRGLAFAAGASVAAVLATAPVAWTVFGEISVPGAAVTVVAVPVFAALLGTAWLWVLAPALPLDVVCVALTKLLCAWLEFADRLPATPLVLPPRPWPLIAGATLATFVAVATRRGERTRCAAGACAACSWAALLFPWQTAPRGLEVAALDVGHGTAVLVRAPGGGAWLFDAGSRDRTRVAQAAVLPSLAAWDVAELSVVASHVDRDHVSALPWIAERFRARVWAGALDERCAAVIRGRGVAFDLDDGTLELASLGPARFALIRAGAHPGNRGSRALAIELGDVRVLLCGDAEGRELSRQIASERCAGPVAVLLAPHHGSDPDGLGELLRRTAPREVWVSAALPAEILAELERRAIRCRQTWSDGVLRFDSTARPP